MSAKKFSLTDKILELTELKDKGLLTEQDFSDAKAKILQALQSPQAEIRDVTRPHSAVFTWGYLDPETEEGSVEMTLCFGDAFRVTTRIGDHKVGEALLRFLEEVGSLSGDWSGTREFVNVDRYYGSKNFAITCFWCHEGKIATEISLDADVLDPFWTIKLRRMKVDQSAWPAMVKQFRDFFAVSEGWE